MENYRSKITRFLLDTLRYDERVTLKTYTNARSLQIGTQDAQAKQQERFGARMAVRKAMPSVHIDPRAGMAYVPGMAACVMENNGLRMIITEHIGANGAIKTGEHRHYGRNGSTQ